MKRGRGCPAKLGLVAQRSERCLWCPHSTESLNAGETGQESAMPPRDTQTRVRLRWNAGAWREISDVRVLVEFEGVRARSTDIW